MKSHHFVVSFRASDEQKDCISRLLNNKGLVTFLKEIQEGDRSSVLMSADILIAWNPSKELKNINKEKLRGIQFVQLLSAGDDHIDPELFSRNCLIASNKGAYAQPMAEHILGMILALYKHLLVQHQKMAKGEFNQLSENRSLKNEICGIIGFGGIGKAAAKLLKPFGTEIFALNTSGKTDEEVSFIGTLNDLDYVLSKSDIIVISLPLNNLTNGLIGKRELELIKPNGTIINVARGAIIKEKDLFNHLKNNKDFFAGIDAWWSEPFSQGSFKLNYPFFKLPNFLGSPHNSAVVPGSLLSGTELAIKNVLRFINMEM
jgi:glycerate dehydrogenase